MRTANAQASPIQINVQASASRNFTAWPGRCRNPRSSTSMPSTKRLKRIQKSSWFNGFPNRNFQLPISNRQLLPQTSIDDRQSEIALVSSSPFALLPRLPNAERLHQFIELRLAHGLLDLRVMQAGAEPLRGIGDAKGESGCLRHMFLQLRQVNFVEGIGHGVIVD